MIDFMGRTLRAGADGSPLGLIHHWYGYTRKYSPALLEKTPFQFAEGAPIGRAVTYVNQLNRDGNRQLLANAVGSKNPFGQGEWDSRRCPNALPMLCLE